MFNIRVYGLIINEQREVLVTDEIVRGLYITKFPGGGMEVGEGTRDCLKREFKEEMNLRVEVGEHIYTTDYYQVSAFNPAHQIISIYYYVHPLENINTPMRSGAFEFDEAQMEIYDREKQIETFRLLKWEDFSANSFSLPIDKLVADMVKRTYV